MTGVKTEGGCWDDYRLNDAIQFSNPKDRREVVCFFNNAASALSPFDPTAT